ncbi:MAG TPA: pitrilysin family protein [Verrucomicrobiota bacterium]|nr:pitrilysin family protein [Verrucomicrobiota bacterium]
MTPAFQTAPPPVPTVPSMPPDTSFKTLSNGLQVILREDHSAPVVSAQIWCRAGSIDEGRWLGAGLSHVLEHMLFKGTTTRAGGRIDQEVQSAGGYMNAYTSFDRTVYWINVPNEGATVAVDILCDIVQNATLPEEELIKELDVIRREMDMGNDDPGRRSGRRLFETAYTRSPYRYPVIGVPDIFNRVTRADILAYYMEKYAPNNCFLVIAGDFRTEAIIAQIEKAFALSGARAVPPSPVVSEPRQTAPRDTIEEAPIELGHFHLAWHTPDVRHDDTPALDVLSTLLGNGRSSRLYQAVRDQTALVHSVSAWVYTPGHAGLFGVSGVCDGDKFPAARTAILDQIERMKNEMVPGDELAKAVKQFTAGAFASRKTMEGQAQDLGSNWMLANDLSFSERYLAAVRRLTPSDLQRVAQVYLTEANRTSYALLPAGSAQTQRFAAVSTKDQPVQALTLSNGLRLLVKEDHRLPFVQFRLALGGGLHAESSATSGITTLLSRLQIKGTHRRSAQQLSVEIESLGGSLEPYAGNHSFGLSAEVLREDFATGLDLFTDVLLNPSFPAEAIERERAAQLAGIRSQRDELLMSAFQAMRRSLFGDQGYGLDVQGTESTVARLSADDLKAFHRRWVVPQGAAMAVFGDVDASSVVKALERTLGEWRGGKPELELKPDIANPAMRQSRERREKEQAVLALGFPATTVTAPDRYALELLQEACSDMGSRLFMRIRDELGLAYYVGASLFLGRTPGFFALYCGTSPEKWELVERELRAQAEGLRRSGLTAEELTRAKAKVIGQKKIARQDLGHLAMTMTLDELYGLGYAHGAREDALYEAVTLGEVQAVAERYLQNEQSVVAVVGGGV